MFLPPSAACFAGHQPLHCCLPCKHRPPPRLLLNVINRWPSKIDPPPPQPARAHTDTGLLLIGLSSCGRATLQHLCSLVYNVSCVCSTRAGVGVRGHQLHWRLSQAATQTHLIINSQPGCSAPHPPFSHPPSSSVTLTFHNPDIPPSLLPSPPPLFLYSPFGALSPSIELQASLPAEVNTANRSDLLFFMFKCLSDCCPQLTALVWGCSAASLPIMIRHPEPGCLQNSLV